MEQAPRRSRVVFFLLDAAARRSGHARALGVVVVVVVDLFRAVLADLHEEGVELRDDEGHPDAHGEVDQREYHEEDVEPDVPVAMSSAMVDASIPAEEEDLRGCRFGRWRASASTP